MSGLLLLLWQVRVQLEQGGGNGNFSMSCRVCHVDLWFKEGRNWQNWQELRSGTVSRSYSYRKHNCETVMN